MTPNVFERSHNLRIRDDVLVFKFRTESLGDKEFTPSLNEALMASVQSEMHSVQPSVVVIDMHAIEQISTATVNQLVQLTQSIHSDQWSLIFYGLSVEHEETIAQRSQPRSIRFAKNESDLRRLVAETPNGNSIHEEEPDLTLTEEEIDQMSADNVTLDDAIRAVERLRG